MKKYITLLLFLTPFVALCQRTLRGKVTNTNGEELIGATVRILGTTRGTATDVDGKFSIEIPSGSNQLIVSYTGFESKTVSIGASNLINVSLSGGKNSRYTTNKRWSVGILGGHCVTSGAITLPIGLTKDYGGKFWGGIRFGCNFINRTKTKVELNIGATYKDYGFKENESTIPYITGIANLKLQRRLFWRISMFAFGGGEYGKLFESQYYYFNPNDSSSKYNIFLHQNDILALTYGGGLSVSFNRFSVDLGFERNSQLDTFDKQYGKTIGGRFSHISFNYFFL